MKEIIVSGWIYNESYQLLDFYGRGRRCLLRGADWNFKHNSGSILSSKRHVMFQAVSRKRFLILKARFRTLASQCEICDRQRGTKTLFFPRKSFFPSVIILPKVLHSHFRLQTLLMRNAKGRRIQAFKNRCSFGYGGAVVIKRTFNFFHF